MSKMKNIFSNDVEVPEIVMQKADAAFQKIKSEDTDIMNKTVEYKGVKGKKKGKRATHGGLRKAAAAAAALAVLVGAGGIVYAAGRYFGIIDFSKRMPENVPAEAVELIQSEIEQTKQEEGTGTIINCEVREALCDSQTITIVYEVSAKESGKYLFVPTDAVPEDNMSNWSSVTGKTAEEYAAEKNLTIVYIGGGIVNGEELGIAASSMEFLSVSDDIMDVYVRAEKANDAKSIEVDLVATAAIQGEENVMKNDIHFALQDLATTTKTVYLSNAEKPADAAYEIKRAEVIQTDLGTYVDIYYRNVNANDPEDGLTFRVLDQSGEAYATVGGSGVEWQEDDTYKQRIILNKCEMTGEIVLEAYDCYEKTVYGVETLEKE
ncbi:MAG: hypothetical protein Q4C58_13980 [Eubacteriales bacterium]|nr:hypothetical protein [Eubacteriales bacterium]